MHVANFAQAIPLANFDWTSRTSWKYAEGIFFWSGLSVRIVAFWKMR